MTQQDVAVNWGGKTWSGETAWPQEPSERTYDLAVRLEHGMTHHPAHPPYSYTLVKKHGEHPYPGGISSAMELLTMGAHVGTHVDAPGHISLDGCIYGGRPVAERQTPHAGVEVGSVEELPPLVGPGHLVDGPALFGREMTPADGFGAEELQSWFDNRETPGPGSIVLFRTGWMRYWEDSDRYLGLATGLPGVKLSGARWLTERGVRAVGSDTVNFEHKPHVSVPALDVHVHLLVEQGVPIMESVNLEGLAADGVYEFFFTAAALRIKGGTGSPIRPLAFAR
ncbi:cyclase family protein [Georgenia thermotolerans]|uniref:Cyclase family protein n=1 Tax=Georgenia thermotolerans TaxID=527326 RepID=A0A7J5UUC8_9MICO|nr:cyclase family protein [Georgenia thermotolerans]KAE8765899.1 cyclase family protein [Georgenia thermotolerans]